jgi:hypothetical protein
MSLIGLGPVYMARDLTVDDDNDDDDDDDDYFMDICQIPQI